MTENVGVILPKLFKSPLFDWFVLINGYGVSQIYYSFGLISHHSKLMICLYTHNICSNINFFL